MHNGPPAPGPEASGASFLGATCGMGGGAPSAEGFAGFPPGPGREVAHTPPAPPPPRGTRGLHPPGWAGGGALPGRTGRRAVGEAPAPAKRLLKRQPAALAPVYGHTTLNAPDLV